MDLYLHSSSEFLIRGFKRPNCSSLHYSSSSTSRVYCSVSVRSSLLPFPPQKAKYHRELQAAVDVVEKACRLCVDVKKSLFSTDGRILEKKDQTPVTVADFGVQALISFRLFPSIPLVAEEDSSFLTSNTLVDSVVSAVTDKAGYGDKPMSKDDVLEAIDRGGKDAFAFGAKPATYWVLDPIDGTKGFLKGCEALYVGIFKHINQKIAMFHDKFCSGADSEVGLALVVEGEIVLGIMGCPNWLGDSSSISSTQDQPDNTGQPGSGTIMAAHVGCGTWMKTLSNTLSSMLSSQTSWIRCFVDRISLVHQARFCISESQTWDSLPLSVLYSSTMNSDSIGDKQVLLLPTCCGSLCKYLMVASGRASVFIYRAKAQTLIKAWDHAVGVICVHEAGGQVSDWKGSQLDLAADQMQRRIIYPPGGVLVTNGNVHNEILEIISSISPVH